MTIYNSFSRNDFYSKLNIEDMISENPEMFDGPLSDSDSEEEYVYPSIPRRTLFPLSSSTLSLEKPIPLNSPCLHPNDDYWMRWSLFRFDKACSSNQDKEAGHLCFKRLKSSITRYSEDKTIEIANGINSKAIIYIFQEIYRTKKGLVDQKNFAKQILNLECKEEFLFSCTKLQNLSLGEQDKKTSEEMLSKFGPGSWLVCYDPLLKHHMLRVKDETHSILHISLTPNAVINELEPIMDLRLEKALWINKIT